MLLLNFNFCWQVLPKAQEKESDSVSDESDGSESFTEVNRSHPDQVDMNTDSNQTIGVDTPIKDCSNNIESLKVKKRKKEVQLSYEKLPETENKKSELVSSDDVHYKVDTSADSSHLNDCEITLPLKSKKKKQKKSQSCDV